MMPNLNGHEFCRFIRSSQKLAHLPIILLSALERKESTQNVEQADVFLAKPVSGEDLIECIEKLLAQEEIGPRISAEYANLKRNRGTIRAPSQ